LKSITPSRAGLELDFRQRGILYHDLKANGDEIFKVRDNIHTHTDVLQQSLLVIQMARDYSQRNQLEVLEKRTRDLRSHIRKREQQNDPHDEEETLLRDNMEATCVAFEKVKDVVTSELGRRVSIAHVERILLPYVSLNHMSLNHGCKGMAGPKDLAFKADRQVDKLDQTAYPKPSDIPVPNNSDLRAHRPSASTQRKHNAGQNPDIFSSRPMKRDSLISSPSLKAEIRSPMKASVIDRELRMRHPFLMRHLKTPCP